MENGQQKDVLFADGLKIGKITKLLFVTGLFVLFHGLFPYVVEFWSC